MKKIPVKNLSIIILFLPIVFVGCDNKPSKKVSPKELNRIAERNLADLEKVLLTGKIDSIMKFYDSSATLSPDGFPLIKGKDSIRAFLLKGMKMAKFSELELKTASINGDKNFIAQSGIMTSEIIVHDSLKFDNSAKFFYLWKLQDDSTYRILSEVNNSKNKNED